MHSYITLKQQSLDKISFFGGFLRKVRFFTPWSRLGGGQWSNWKSGEGDSPTIDGRGERIRTSATFATVINGFDQTYNRLPVSVPTFFQGLPDVVNYVCYIF